MLNSVKREIQENEKSIALPDKFEIHEFRDPQLRDELLRAIPGEVSFAGIDWVIVGGESGPVLDRWRNRGL